MRSTIAFARTPTMACRPTLTSVTARRTSLNVLLALLLAVALLFCHGFFGALHQLPGPAGYQLVAGKVVGEDHPLSHARGHSDHRTSLHLGHADYCAVVLVSVLLLGALARLLLSRAWRWRDVDAARFLGQLLPPCVPHRPRGPTAPLLQVFRL